MKNTFTICQWTDTRDAITGTHPEHKQLLRQLPSHCRIEHQRGDTFTYSFPARFRNQVQRTAERFLEERP